MEQNAPRRRALRAADPPSQSVTQIATPQGFRESGRFSARYREMIWRVSIHYAAERPGTTFPDFLYTVSAGCRDRN